jgi:hypothetical protein
MSTVRLAIVLSLTAALTAVLIDADSALGRTALLVSVAVVGLVSSWVMTGRDVRPVPRPAHRVAVVPIRQRVG